MEMMSAAMAIVMAFFAYGSLDDAQVNAMADRLSRATTAYEIIETLETAPASAQRSIRYESFEQLGQGGVVLRRVVFDDGTGPVTVDRLEVATLDVASLMAGQPPRALNVSVVIDNPGSFSKMMGPEFPLELENKAFTARLAYTMNERGVVALGPVALELEGSGSLSLSGTATVDNPAMPDPMASTLQDLRIRLTDVGMIEQFLETVAREEGRPLADIRQEALQEMTILPADFPQDMIPLAEALYAMVANPVRTKGSIEVAMTSQGRGLNGEDIMGLMFGMSALEDLDVSVSTTLAPEVAAWLEANEVAFTQAEPFDFGFGASPPHGEDYDPYFVTDTYENLRPRAEKGDVEAQFQLGVIFEDGLGVAEDPEQAFYWFNQAAQSWHTHAMASLGDYYYGGFGVAQDYEQAAYWYTMAAQMGEPWSQYYLAEMYLNGEGVAQDLDTAMMWVNMAADQPGDHQSDAFDLRVTIGDVMGQSGGSASGGGVQKDK